MKRARRQLNPNYIPNAEGRPAFAHQVAQLLGFENGRIPVETDLTFHRWITAANGKDVLVWIERQVPGMFRLRVRAECPTCKRGFAASRLPQHVCKDGGK